MMAEGYIYKEIGEEMKIAAETVRTHVKNICQKLHVRNRLEAIAKHRHEFSDEK
jgi:DNA-binding CsgD family transcriptional regulator